MTTPIKSVLRVVQKLMAAPAAAEATRNLVDTDLPKTLKTMFEHSAMIGNRIMNIGESINVVRSLI